MAKHKFSGLTGVERSFDSGEIIVSKTDLKGRITYANKVFLRVGGFQESEILGAPHSILRHPAMPRCVFKLLWDTLGAGQEIFAYVLNRANNGDHYWVFAHVTPSYDASKTVVGYHSNRRVPDMRVVNTVIAPLYKDLLEEEHRHSNAKEGMQRSFRMLEMLLKEKGMGYEKLIFSL